MSSNNNHNDNINNNNNTPNHPPVLSSSSSPVDYVIMDHQETTAPAIANAATNNNNNNHNNTSVTTDLIDIGTSSNNNNNNNNNNVNNLTIAPNQSRGLATPPPSNYGYVAMGQNAPIMSHHSPTSTYPVGMTGIQPAITSSNRNNNVAAPNDYIAMEQQHHQQQQLHQKQPQSSTDFDPTLAHLNLTESEFLKLRELLKKDFDDETSLKSQDSEYTEFAETTHAWAIFADDPKKRASKIDRLVGTAIICFQLFTYSIFASEAIEDYENGQVIVTVSHASCIASDEEPDGNFECDANFTNNWDAFIAFFMLSIFMTPAFLQSGRAVRAAPHLSAKIFASLAFLEVVVAFFAASICVSYNLYIGEITDAVEVGVGLLFIREMSSQTYLGIRQKKSKSYIPFFTVLLLLIVIGYYMDPLCEYLFAKQY